MIEEKFILERLVKLGVYDLEFNYEILIEKETEDISTRENVSAREIKIDT